MFKIIRSDKDAYITDKLVKGERKVKSNTGCAGSLDLYKLYGVTYSGSSPNVEISRLLVHFDLSSIRQLFDDGLIDVNNSSFWCKLKLRDVYGGQPAPSNFNIDVFPLSGTFVEGIGKDTRYYSDLDVCNWLSSSATNVWFVSGCNKPCDAQLGGGDYITSSIDIIDTKVTQYFKIGDEDLEVDVTKIVSSTLAGHIPDAGFRISFANSEEDDGQTYFVKRFASSDAYDESKHPTLMMGFDNSVEDDSQNLTLDYPGKLTLYNWVSGRLTNIVSSSVDVSGPDCLALKMMTQVSGGYYDLLFTGSQFSYSPGSTVSGSYYAIVNISSTDPIIAGKLQVSSSIEFLPVWESLDGTIGYVTGSAVTAKLPTRSGEIVPKNYVVKILNMKDEYSTDESMYLRLHIFDQSSPLIKVVKLPVELPGIVVKNAHYQIRDAVTGEIIVPFDTAKNSTKVSSDASGMFFKIDGSDLICNRTYTIDILLDDGYSSRQYTSVSPPIRLVKRNTL